MSAETRAADARLADVARVPGSPKPDPILVVNGVGRAFGGLIAVEVDHLEVQRNTITAMIGPNGAGKTTFFNLLTGFDAPDRGTWTFDGQSMEDISAHKAARMGMVRTFQLTKALSRMSVMENMKLGAPKQAGEKLWWSLFGPRWRAQETAIEKQADELLSRFNLAHMRNEFAGNLSGGQRKLLEMARALMADPTLIMLDEPMAGVNPALKQSLLDHIRLLKDEGRTVLFVEHDMDMVHEISDWVVVLAQGTIIAEGPPASVGANQDVIDAYLGAHHDMDLAEIEEVIEQEIAAEEEAAQEADE